jgi:homogentisate 1,2-dioxygenase
MTDRPPRFTGMPTRLELERFFPTSRGAHPDPSIWRVLVAPYELARWRGR